MKNSASGPSSSANLSDRIERLARRGGRGFGHGRFMVVRRHAASLLDPRDRLGEVARGEGLEIVDALADADEMDGQRELVGDRDENAAARRAVELGHHEAGDAGDAAENLDLAQRVLPDRGVEHEQHRVRRVRRRPSASRG